MVFVVLRLVPLIFRKDLVSLLDNSAFRFLLGNCFIHRRFQVLSREPSFLRFSRLNILGKILLNVLLLVLSFTLLEMRYVSQPSTFKGYVVIEYLCAQRTFT